MTKHCDIWFKGSVSGPNQGTPDNSTQTNKTRPIHQHFDACSTPLRGWPKTSKHEQDSFAHPSRRTRRRRSQLLMGLDYRA